MDFVGAAERLFFDTLSATAAVTSALAGGAAGISPTSYVPQGQAYPAALFYAEAAPLGGPIDANRLPGEAQVRMVLRFVDEGADAGRIAAADAAAVLALHGASAEYADVHVTAYATGQWTGPAGRAYVEPGDPALPTVERGWVFTVDAMRSG